MIAFDVEQVVAKCDETLAPTTYTSFSPIIEAIPVTWLVSIRSVDFPSRVKSWRLFSSPFEACTLNESLLWSRESNLAEKISNQLQL